MAVRRNQPVAAKQPAQNQEADETHVLSPRTTSRHLLSSIQEPPQERRVSDRNKRFQPHYDDRRRESTEYKMKIDFPSYDDKRKY